MLEGVLNNTLPTMTQLPEIELNDGAPISDEILVQAVLDGDEQAFSQIFEKYCRSVTRVVGRFFRDRSEIEEFVQQSFTKTYFSLRNFRGGLDNSFPAWITRIAVNVCYDEFRRRQRRPETSFADLGDDGGAYFESRPARNTPSAERSIAAAELA